MIRLLNTLLILFFFSANSYAQSVLDELEVSPIEPPSEVNLITEQVDKIGPSKKIFIITNENRNLNKGDFISFVLNDELVARALVAKTERNLAGVKILKIYSLDQWNKLAEGKTIQVIRGDDSFFRNREQQAPTETAQIESEEDLFDETTLLNDDLTLEENTQRVIRTDNMISLNYGFIEGIDNTGTTTNYQQINGTWAYQLEDNIWAEALYGQNIVKDFPNPGLNTKVTNITIRGKYAINAPFNSYVLPYVGYQIIGADSPNAGEPSENFQEGDPELARELERVEELKQKRVVFGVSAFKRLVPGWFIRADIGNDIMGFGFALEF